MPGQTLSEIRSLLAAAGLVPQHRFGQNFLIDLNLMRKLVAAAELSPQDVVLEVGAGTGSLTEMLLDAGPRVVAVEIDRGLVAVLRDRLGDHPRFTLISGDALSTKSAVNPLITKLLLERPPLPGGAYKLVANLPYQIATPLLLDLLIGRPRFERLTCTIQREVGERLAAAPRTESYGPVSVVTQVLCRAQPIAILPPSVFWPPPQVESIMLTLRPRPPGEIDVTDVPGFVAFVRRAFLQRRKLLRTKIVAMSPARSETDDLAWLAAFARAGVNPDARAEELPPAAWTILFAELQRISAR